MVSCWSAAHGSVAAAAVTLRVQNPPAQSGAVQFMVMVPVAADAGGAPVATIWTNGAARNLTNGTYDAVAESVFVTNSDIFVAGYEDNLSGKAVAKVWRNGSPYQTLSNGSNDAYAMSMTVSNSITYVAGYENNSQGRPVATLWTNGTARKIGDESYQTFAYNVHVSNGSVYVAGEYRRADGGGHLAVLWVNGELQVLGDGYNQTTATAVATANGNVYVAGTEFEASGMQNVMLWTNGSPRRISDGRARANAHSIATHNNDVYLCGGYQKYSVSGYNFPAYWKNGAVQDLEPALQLTVGGYARSIAVSGGSVFAAGVQRSLDNRDYAVVWENGTATSLASNAEARGVFVR